MHRKEKLPTCIFPLAAEGNAPCSDDHVDVRVEAHVAAPGVEDGGEAYGGPKIVGGLCKLLHCGGSTREEQPKHLGWILQYQLVKFSRNRKCRVKVFYLTEDVFCRDRICAKSKS